MRAVEDVSGPWVPASEVSSPESELRDDAGADDGVADDDRPDCATGSAERDRVTGVAASERLAEADEVLVDADGVVVADRVPADRT